MKTLHWFIVKKFGNDSNARWLDRCKYMRWMRFGNIDDALHFHYDNIGRRKTYRCVFVQSETKRMSFSKTFSNWVMFPAQSDNYKHTIVLILIEVVQGFGMSNGRIWQHWAGCSLPRSRRLAPDSLFIKSIEKVVGRGTGRSERWCQQFSVTQMSLKPKIVWRSLSVNKYKMLHLGNFVISQQPVRTSFRKFKRP